MVSMVEAEAAIRKRVGGTEGAGNLVAGLEEGQGEETAAKVRMASLGEGLGNSDKVLGR